MSESECPTNVLLSTAEESREDFKFGLRKCCIGIARTKMLEQGKKISRRGYTAITSNSLIIRWRM